MADGRHLENRYDIIFRWWMIQFGWNSAAGCGMTCRLRKKWSRSKPEVEFQYGGPLYFETGSSYISAANSDIWTKFGLLIDFDLLKAVTLTNTKPEVVSSGRGRHFVTWIWRHISTVGAPIWTKFGSRMRNDTPITERWSRSKPEVEFQYGGRLYFETGSSYISAANWDIWTKLVCW